MAHHHLRVRNDHDVLRKPFLHRLDCGAEDTGRSLVEQHEKDVVIDVRLGQPLNVR